MAAMALSPLLDHKTGFSNSTRTFHSLRSTSLTLPPHDEPISVASFALRSLRPDDNDHSTAAIIDSTSGRRLSFADFLNQVRSLAASLLQWLSKGSVAFVLAPNSPQVPVLYFALLSIGVVVSPANPLSSPADVSHQIRLSRPDVVFATTATAYKLPSNLSIPVLLLHSHVFDQMLACDGDASRGADMMMLQQSEPAAILYSSGTTGLVKGVVLTHRNLIASIVGFCAVWGHDSRPSPHVNLVPLPLFHVLGFTKWLSSMALREAVVLMERFDVGRALKAVEEFKVTIMPTAPPVVAAMVKYFSGDRPSLDLSSLEEVACGGAALSGKLAAMFAAKFPWVRLQPGYGMTEAGPVAQTRGLKPPYHGSVGQLFPNLEAKIVDTNAGEALLPGQSGELWLRGPSIMQGYVGDEAATSSVLDSEGWFRTGDVCYFDEIGRIHVVDRLKEMIKYKGYQVPPAELEHLLHSHPEITEAAVIPQVLYPDEEAGEVPMAFVVKVSGSALNQLQVMDFVARHVAPYKKIRRVAMVESIPKNPTGKILRKELIKIAVSNTASKL